MIRYSLARYSELSEVTSRNVRGLLPLVAVPVGANALQPVLCDPYPADLRQSSRGAPVQSWFSDDRPNQIQLTVRENQQADMNVGVSYLIGSRAVASGARTSSAPEQSELTAWDAAAQRPLWRATEDRWISSEMLVTAGGLIFYGSTDGWLKARDARTGRVLWTYRVGDGKLSEPLSYRGANGHQYIAVLSGIPGKSSGTLNVFALPH
jgi:PQQ-like domain